jgi:hypothetical protein
VAVLEQLAAAGAGLSIDGFGTGYSSLSYLNQFSFDTVKVDRAFVQARSQNGTGAAALRSIVALTHELGKKVVAEGVEVEDDVGFLRSINCEYGQGFYYGEPMPERDVVQLLKVVRRAERRLKKSVVFRQRATVRAAQAPAVPEQAVNAGRAGPQMPSQTNGAFPAARLPMPAAARARPSVRPLGPPRLPALGAPRGGVPPSPPPLPGTPNAALAPAPDAQVTFQPTPLRAEADKPVPAAPRPQRPAIPPNGARAAPPGAMGAGPPPLPSRPHRAGGDQSSAGPPIPHAPARRSAPRGPGPDLSKLPPAIRASLAKLAGEDADEENDSPGKPPVTTG